jgi:hypothetical protein
MKGRQLFHSLTLELAKGLLDYFIHHLLRLEAVEVEAFNDAVGPFSSFY